MKNVYFLLCAWALLGASAPAHAMAHLATAARANSLRIIRAQNNSLQVRHYSQEKIKDIGTKVIFTGLSIPAGMFGAAGGGFVGIALALPMSIIPDMALEGCIYGKWADRAVTGGGCAGSAIGGVGASAFVGGIPGVAAWGATVGALAYIGYKRRLKENELRERRLRALEDN